MLPIVSTVFNIELDLTLKESFPLHAAMPSSMVRCWVGVYTTWKAAQILSSIGRSLKRGSKPS